MNTPINSTLSFFLNTKTQRRKEKTQNVFKFFVFLRLCVFVSLCLKNKKRIVSITQIVFVSIFFATTPLLATMQPWGKDADLAIKRPCNTTYSPPPTCKTPFLGTISEAVISFHQTTITACDGPRSNFRPSSSQYMLDAMRKYGFFQGFSMGCDRLMRENKDPWVYRKTLNETKELIKWDPVP